MSNARWRGALVVEHAAAAAAKITMINISLL